MKFAFHEVAYKLNECLVRKSFTASVYLSVWVPVGESS